MSAIITAAFKATFGLLVNKARDKAAEKLKEGDVTDRLRELIQREIDDIKSRLDALARKDLLAAIDAFEVGVKYLYQAMEADVNLAMAGTSERSNEASPTATVNTVTLATEIGTMELKELNEKTKMVLYQAKERFKMAREVATHAVNNEALRTLDRIKAIRYRIMAAMLESAVETVGTAGDLSSLSVKSALENALPECEQCLLKLNSLPDVQNNFKVELDQGLLNVKGRFGRNERREIISAVCQVNRAIYDATLAAGKYRLFLNLPSVDTEEDTIDPLRDERVAKVLRKVGMEHCCLKWTFGQEGERGHKLKGPLVGIATNEDGQFIIADRSVNVFDSNGKFVLQIGLEPKSALKVRDVATDLNSNIYVLLTSSPKLPKPPGEPQGELPEVQVFNHTADLLHKFPVRRGYRLAVTNNKVLVLTRGEEAVDVYEHEGRYVRSFGKEILGYASDITATPDGQVMIFIFDWDDPHVLIFTEDGEQQCKFNINTKEDSYGLIKCHPSGQFVVVAGCERETKHLCVAIYTKDGECVRRIKLNERLEDFNINGMTVSMEGRIALAVSNRNHVHASQVIVL